MKKWVVLFSLLPLLICSVFAQRIPAVGVMVLNHSGAGITAQDAVNITNRIIQELNSWGTINASLGSAGAEYIISGSIVRQGNNYTISGTTKNAATDQTLNEYREQIPVSNIDVFAFCAKAVERVPFPNYLAGTWQSTLNMPDGPVVCIIEFKTDRSILVDRYDTWEYRQGNSLRYEGYGSGSYSYIGYANRTITVNSRHVRIDATVSINLGLEETLPDQTNVSLQGLAIVFSGDRSSFEIVNGSLPCGRNYDGASVYPAEYLGFVNFVKR